MTIADADGTILFERPTSVEDGIPSLTCAGDIDGDGAMEILVDDTDFIRAFRTDGSEAWSIPMFDQTDGYVGCTSFDFNVDGADEVVYSDELRFLILDGRGNTLYRDDSWRTATVADEKIVADLDGDGSVEILSTTGLGVTSYRVYRNVNRDWPPGLPIWPVANWSGTSVNRDGSVPRTADAPWLTTKVWRGQPEYVIEGADLRVDVSASCVASCEHGTADLAVRVSNLGPGEVDEGIPVAVYDSAGSLLTVLNAPSWIDNRTALADMKLSVPLEIARVGIRLVVGDDGSGELALVDCDSANNTVTWRLDACD